MLVLNTEEIKQAISMNEAIHHVAMALEEFSKGRSTTPVRSAIPIEKEQATALFMPSYVESLHSLGMKFVSVFPKNKELGKNTIYGVMVLADNKTGETLALMDASYLTVLRTGAASGLATKLLAKKNAKSLTVIGTGAQAKGLIEAILTVRPIEEITLYNRTVEKAEKLKEEILQVYKHLTVSISEDSDEAVKGADVVVTATNSTFPVVREGAIREGTHINAIGSFRPTMQELPSGLMASASKIVVEAKEAALEETGDLLNPIREGVITPEDIYGELGDISLGKKAGRESDEEITIFKSVGLAAMDVVIAKAIYDQAVSRGLGVSVHF